MKFVVSAILVLVFNFARETVSHPQCLDFKPPFKPAKNLNICKEYEAFGCCTLKDDSEIATKYNEITNAMTESQLSTCGKFLTSLLCQKCSPYAVHIYNAEDDQIANSFPGLCQSYCESLMQECSFLIPMVTDDANLIKLSKNEDSSTFCSTVLIPDAQYCYPDVANSEELMKNIGTVEFYKTNDQSNDKKSCTKLCVEEIANGLSNPIQVRSANDGTQRLFVQEQGGAVWIYLPDKSKISHPFFNMRDLKLADDQTFDSRGMFDFVFHPNYKSNGLFYAHYLIVTDTNPSLTISEFKVSDVDMNRIDPKSQRDILNVPEPSPNNQGAHLRFGLDGYLYIFNGDGVGDTSTEEDPYGKYGSSQNKKTLLGKVLRINVDDRPRGRPYSIPPDNPFVNDAEYSPEIYALGVKNMWRCGMDKGDETGKNRGRVICGDVGDADYEEVNILKKGANYGWKYYEGYSCFGNRDCDNINIENYEPPIHVYDHTVGISVMGGQVYRGCQMPNMKGKYIFGDLLGKIFQLEEDSQGKWMNETICIGSANICKNGGLQSTRANFILSFGEDENGELYIIGTDDFSPGNTAGRIYRLIDPSRRGDPDICPNPKAKGVILGAGTSTIQYKIN
ncbi:HHIP-like protein 2 [Styela clava]